MSLRDQLIPPHEGKKVAICGFAESWKQAPFDDQTFEIWGLNELHKYVPRWNRWWEIHDGDTLGVTRRDASDGEQQRHVEWLSKQHGPNKIIYMRPEFIGRFPNAVAHPVEDLCALFGRYFTSTIGYMVAMAITDGYQTIHLYGVDLASDVEYPYQRPNAEYLIGIARGLGREVLLAPTSAICKAGHLYGHETSLNEGHPMLTAVKGHLTALKKKHDETLATLNTLDGAIQECENFLKLPDYLERGVALTTY